MRGLTLQVHAGYVSKTHSEGRNITTNEVPSQGRGGDVSTGAGRTAAGSTQAGAHRSRCRHATSSSSVYRLTARHTSCMKLLYSFWQARSTETPARTCQHMDAEGLFARVLPAFIDRT